MVSINNSIDNTIGASNSGVTNTLTVQNPSNTASSAALVNVTVGGGTSSDPFTTYTVTGVTNWSQGIDNSDSDAYVLSASTALGTTNVMRAATAGQITYPLQPAFAAYKSATTLNATGDGTLYVVICDTEVIDVGNNYNNATGVFTAPVTGRYFFCSGINAQNFTVAHTGGDWQNVASSGGHYYGLINPANVRRDPTGNNDITLAGSVILQMTAGDTASLNLSISGGTKTVSVIGLADRTYFQGFFLG